MFGLKSTKRFSGSSSDSYAKKLLPPPGKKQLGGIPGKLEDVPFFRSCTKIFNKVGEDVTPKPLTDVSLEQRLASQSQLYGDSGSFVQMSLEYLTAQGALLGSGGNFGRLSFSHQPGSLNEEINQSVKDGHDQTVDAGLQSSKDELKKVGDELLVPATQAELSDEIEVMLTETELYWLVDISGSVVSSESEDASDVIRSNEIYMELLRNRPGNEGYCARAMNTIVEPLKSKGVQTSKSTSTDKAVAISWSELYDALGACDAMGLATEDGSRPDAGISVVVENDLEKKEDGDDVHTNQTVDGNSASLMEAVASRKGSPMAGGDAVCVLSDLSLDVRRPKALDDVQILQSESFMRSLFYMERAINLNTYTSVLATYRALPLITEALEEAVEEAPEEILEAGDKSLSAKSSASLALSLGLRIERLWSYGCSLTRGHNISCMTSNSVNPDLLAIGYCQFEYTNQKPGLVCCWSFKNPEYPERIYRTEAGVIAVSFSVLQPCLLAVGLRDGVIAIYNVATSSKEPILDTQYDVASRNLGPVWGLKWIVRDHEDLEGEEPSTTGNEVLMSVSLDGHVKQWMIRQGFKCKEMLKLKHLPRRLPSEKQNKRKADIAISKYDGGLCFHFSPFDCNIYLVGTEEGYIHRCSCLHTEQPLDTYIGHTGPVYQVRWSPFDKRIFVSCSGDWSVHVWHQRVLTPLISIASATVVFDVKWCPQNSTVLAFVNEAAIEIWDLSQNTFDPVVVYSKPSPETKLSCLMFSKKSDCLLVGDSEGQVAVYQLLDVVSEVTDQVLALQNVVRTALEPEDKK